MKKILTSFLLVSLIALFVSCDYPSAEIPTDNENKEQQKDPEETVSENIVFAISKAVDNEDYFEDINISSIDEYWEHEGQLIENLAFGSYKGSFTKIRSLINGCDLDFENFSVQGNISAETKLLDYIDRRGYNNTVLYIGSDETSEKVTVTAKSSVSDYSRSVDFYICSKKLTKVDVSDFENKDTVSFESPIYIDKDGFNFLKQLLVENSERNYDFDFSNCWFALNKIPNGAFCSPSHDSNSFGESDIISVEEWGLGNVGNVNLPAVLYNIKMGAFYGCYNLTTTFPSTITQIDSYAFAGCKRIEVSTLPPEAFVSPESFAGSERITEVSLNHRLAYFSAYSFCKNLETIKIGKNVEEVGSTLYAMYGNFVVDESNKYFKSIGGILYSKDESVLYKVTNSNCGFSLRIPSSVKEISSYAITSCNNLHDIYIPESIKKIDYKAISDNPNLVSININLAKKPSDWDESWVLGAYNWDINNFVEPEIYWIGTNSDGNNDADNTGENGTLSGTYKVVNNNRCTLKFSGNAVERFDNGRSIETYTYTLSGNNFVLTSDRPESKNYPGEFEIIFTDSGFILNKKNDAALSWTGLWTQGNSTDTVEFVR